MSLLFIASLPRTSVLGIADLFYRGIISQSQIVTLTGHLHLLAELSNSSIYKYQSPLNLYQCREALVRCILSLHDIPFSIDNYQGILQHYFSRPGNNLDSCKIESLLLDTNALVIDPSFSHSMDPSLIYTNKTINVDHKLLILWTNPILFCTRIMDGVFAFDSCLHWLLSHPSFSFPIDPLKLWLSYVQSYLPIIDKPPSHFSNVTHIQRELISSTTAKSILSPISIDYKHMHRPTMISEIAPYLNECPYSGDPSYLLDDLDQKNLSISLKELGRYSNDPKVIDDVVNYSQIIGYSIAD